MFEIQPQYHKTKVEKKGRDCPMSNQMRPSHSSTDCKNGVWKCKVPLSMPQTKDSHIIIKQRDKLASENHSPSDASDSCASSKAEAMASFSTITFSSTSGLCSYPCSNDLSNPTARIWHWHQFCEGYSTLGVWGGIVQLGFKQSAHNNQEQVRKDYYSLAGRLEIYSLEQRETQREKKG